MILKKFLLVLQGGAMRVLGPYDTVEGRLAAAEEMIWLSGSDVWWADTYSDGSLSVGSCRIALAMRGDR